MGILELYAFAHALFGIDVGIDVLWLALEAEVQHRVEVLSDGFGFLRSPDANYLPGPDDTITVWARVMGKREVDGLGLIELAMARPRTITRLAKLFIARMLARTAA